MQRSKDPDKDKNPKPMVRRPSNSKNDPPGKLVYEYTLPAQIPDSWINEIRNTIKEKRTAVILTTILGSSLLAGLASIGGNYLIEYRKASLLIKGKLAGDRYDNYSDLYKKIGFLERALKGTEQTIRQAAKSADLKPETVSDTIHESIVKGEEVRAAVDSPFIEEDIKKLIEGKLDPLGPALFSTQNPPDEDKRKQALDNLANICDRLVNDIKEIKQHLYQRMDSLSP
jgi:hypothetical protein